MIKKKTVFVLGAGASRDFNYPLGLGLVDDVRRNLETRRSDRFSQLEAAGFSAEEINAFVSEMIQSGTLSVDAFLEHRPTHLSIGKYAIAQALLPYENQDTLFTTANMNWYQFIFSKMNASFENFSSNAVAFITFNYDKSLEHFLFTTLKNKYGKNDVEARDRIQNLNIIHVYGTLGKLFWEIVGGRNYGCPFNQDVLKNAALGINIIHEGTNLNQSFLSAHAQLSVAQRVYFLGFGYDETNLLRLRIAETIRPEALVMGTVLGLREAEQNHVLNTFSANFGRPLRVFDASVLEFLRSSAFLD